jgi:hypothetical protein
MKKIILSIVGLLFLVGCSKDKILPTIKEVKPELQITNKVGIKLESSFVTTEVAMNVKFELDGVATIKILDISNKVVSKEQISVKSGNNVLKVYTSTLPPSAYRVGLYDLNNNLLGITDFNKIN